MNYELFYPYDNSRLWTKNFILLSIVNFLVYASTYMLLPATVLRMMEQPSCNYIGIGLSLAVFGIGMFLPGMFNSYLIDRFKRKSICMLSITGMALTGYLHLYIDTLDQLMFLRLAQGALFGMATMTVGSTLVIDVTVSHRRTSANMATNRISLLAIAWGLAVGIGLMTYSNFENTIYVYTVNMVISLLLLVFVGVAFRAPLQSPVISLDRYLLPRALYPAICTTMLSVISGIVIMRIFTFYFYLYLLVGMAIAFLTIRFHWPDKFKMKLGAFSIAASMMILLTTHAFTESCIASILLGAGMGLCATTLYSIMIQVARHCERGTAHNTFQLFWESGILVGILLECVSGSRTSLLYVISLSLIALVLLIYKLSLQKWYKNQLENK